jgi:alpha-beta hydrolase superfamily lysophospholipase
MSHIEFEQKSFDGLSLYFQGWQTDIEPKGVICLVHGLGEHSGRYTQWASFLNQAGYTVLSFDLRGHGKSQGKKGHAPSFDAYMKDISILLGEGEKRFPGLPYFLYGHSLGGILVSNYILREKPQLEGVIITSPGFKTALEQQKVKIVLAKISGSLVPGLSMPTGLDPHAISRDPEVVTKYINDPLVHGVATAAMAKNTFNAISWAFQHASEWSLPLLLMHGEKDQIAFVQGSREFASKIKGDCTLKIWPGMYHEIHNEPEKEQVFQYLREWLDKHSHKS